MQKMDCCNFKDMLDSYLCQELAVETNHAMLSHAEHCSPCRTELASRRNLRQALRRACTEDRMSDEACERLRALLRAEATTKETRNSAVAGWRERWAAFFKLPLLRPVPAMAAVLILIAGAFALYRLQGNVGIDRVAAMRLSDALMADAAEDHQMCVRYVKPDSLSAGIPDTVRNFDEGCVGLDKVLANEAIGFQLCSAHVCSVKDGRRFAHLIYKHDAELISLLVTPRDAKALKIGKLLELDALQADFQESHREDLAVGAYQTSKRVVLVVSKLPESENEKLAQTLALPVVAHLRQIEGQRAFLNLAGIDVIASVKGGELK
jgi:anti-sigma factor RsiW